MKLIVKICLLTAVMVISIETIFAQADIPTVPIPDVPQFYVDALNFSSDQPGSSRLDIYVEVPYEALHFIKKDDVFSANYEVTVNIFDTADKLAGEKLWNETVETKDYNESISPKAGNLSQKSFALAPGEYSVTVQVQDNDTRKISRIKRDVKIRDFLTGPLSMSDIMLVKRISKEGEKKILYPYISANVGEFSEIFYLFFEIYNQSKADSAILWSVVKNTKGDVLQRDSLVQQLGHGEKPCFVQVDNSNLLTGEYTIEVQAFALGANVEKEVLEHAAISSHAFVIRWRGLPVSVAELDQAIDELQYMTEKDKIDEIRDAPPELKRKKFYEFWKKRDPTPNTERNELMEEYYARVAYVNKNFSHYTAGWKTDMGMVYIIFGPPSNIERHPFDIDTKPYEVWTYYEHNREFVFIDATGFGDYRLQNPIWDVWRTQPR